MKAVLWVIGLVLYIGLSIWATPTFPGKRRNKWRK